MQMPKREQLTGEVAGPHCAIVAIVGANPVAVF